MRLAAITAGLLLDLATGTARNLVDVTLPWLAGVVS